MSASRATIVPSAWWIIFCIHGSQVAATSIWRFIIAATCCARLELEELDLARCDPLPLQDRQHRIVGRGAPEEPMVLP